MSSEPLFKGLIPSHLANMPHNPQASVDSTTSTLAFEDDRLLQDGSGEGAPDEKTRMTEIATSLTGPVHENARRLRLSRELIMMLVCFGLGAFFAIGHHIFYLRLNGQEAGSEERQQWSIRYV